MAKPKDSVPGSDPDLSAPREEINPNRDSGGSPTFRNNSDDTEGDRAEQICAEQICDADRYPEESTPSQKLLYLSTKLQEREEELEIARLELNIARSILLQKEQLLNSITKTLGWRLLTRFGPIKHGYILPAVQAFKNLLAGRPLWQPSQKRTYKDWVRLCEQYRYKPERAAKRIESLACQPKISIILPCYNTPGEYLRKALDSVIAQYYQTWELCICDDSSTEAHVRKTIDEYVKRDTRIKAVYSDRNGGIVAASNQALELATGEFAGFLDHDDELTPDALFEVVQTLQDRTIDWVYSDEDKIDPNGKRGEALAKPAWSPDHLLSTMYTCHFSVYKTELVRKAGGLRPGFDGSQDHDLALRIAEHTERVAHIPKVLYHWRKIPGSSAGGTMAKPYAYDSAIKALSGALKRRRIEGTVEPGTIPGQFRVKRKIVKPEKVSILIPTRDKLNLLRKCIESIEAKTDYLDYEIIIIDNGSTDKSTLAYLRASPHRVIRDEGPFNFSRLNNLAAKEATGAYLLLLNNDTELINAEWMSAMVEHAQRPEVGAVGAKLLYSRCTIQHAGVVVGIHGVADHAHRHVDGKKPASYFNFAGIIRDYSAVTAACMMTRREVFLAAGGFNEKTLAVSFNDIDYCLRLRERGLLVVYTPYAELYHHESATRSKAVDISENSYMLGKWGQYIRRDPYYNPSMSLDYEDFRFDYSKPEGFVAAFSQDLPEHMTGTLIKELRIGQYLYAGAEDVCGIRVMFGDLEPKTKGTVRLHLCRSHQRLDDMATSEVDVSSISPKDGWLFLMDPVREPGCDRLYFYLDYEGDEPGPSVWKSKTNSSLLGPHYQN
ncbi:MAG: glycosyltransferase family 2 protein, partial [Blastocatellia bacterium]